LPFRLRQLHPDNDSAILNQLLFDYCQQSQIALSRSRPLKKNDNCWVEQKNRTHVCQLLGYHRLCGELPRRLVAELYWAWTQWRNFFQPSCACQKKPVSAVKSIAATTKPLHPISGCSIPASSALPLVTHYSVAMTRLSPKKLMHMIQEKQQQLFTILRKSDAKHPRRIHPPSVTSFLTQQPAVRLPR
jgi:hypothetical protein